MALKKEIEEIESLIPKASISNPNISVSGVDWHLDHTLKVIISICDVLKKSDPTKYKSSFNISWQAISLTGTIPRGRGKAPEFTKAKEEIKVADIQSQLEEAKSALQSIESLPANSYFKHPYFGMLNLKGAQKFLRIHTRHHLKIMRDIIK